MEENKVTLEENAVDSMGNFQIERSENPFVLGVIRGPFMYIGEVNGNAREYTLETIQKKIIDDEYVKNMIANKSLLGEIHHPEGRSSIWMNHACISTTKLWLSSDKKVLMGEADILDTELGRLLWTLVCYGTKIGISARANGDGIPKGNKLVVPPSTYFFKTFDVVLNPGFKMARPSVYDNRGNLKHFGTDSKRIFEETDEKENIKQWVKEGKVSLETLEGFKEYLSEEVIGELSDYSMNEEETPVDNETLDFAREIYALEEELSETAQLALDLNDELKQMTEENENLVETIEKNIKNIDYNESVNEALKEADEVSSKRLSLMKGRVYSLSEELSEKDIIIDSLKDEVSAYQERVAHLESMLEECSSTINELADMCEEVVIPSSVDKVDVVMNEEGFVIPSSVDKVEIHEEVVIPSSVDKVDTKKSVTVSDILSSNNKRKPITKKLSLCEETTDCSIEDFNQDNKVEQSRFEGLLSYIGGK